MREAAGGRALRRPRLIVIGPLPPPTHGVSISTGLVLANPRLNPRFSVEHLDTSDKREDRANIGRWDIDNILVALQSVWRLLRRLRGERGIVYVPLSQGLAGFLRDGLFILCASKAGWKVAVHLRGGEFDRFHAAQPRLMRWWIRRVLRHVDSMAVLGSSLTGVFEGLVPAERLAVVPNGTPDLGRHEQTRNGDTVLFLSNLRRRKGLLEAVEAAELVISRHPTARFVFIGDWEDDDLADEVRDRTGVLADRISFLPVVTGEAKSTALLSASILLFPPVLPEGHPRVVLEALAAGLPVVTTDRGAIAETVIDGESGYVLADPVPEQLAHCILKLLNDAELHQRMARAARARYESDFSQARADDRLADWLDQVARREH